MKGPFKRLTFRVSLSGKTLELCKYDLDRSLLSLKQVMLLLKLATIATDLELMNYLRELHAMFV